MNSSSIDLLARQLATDSIRATTTAGSGHPTSAMSAAHLLATLLSRHFKARINEPDDPANDRLVLSKGHAAPLLYAALAAIDVIPEAELTTLREPGSRLEGHPVPTLPLIDVATGSLGQGLANGLGMAMGLQKLGSNARVWVILGDSEMSEGSVWEAMALASHHYASNLRAIIDMNRLGQTGPTMLGWNADVYVRRARAFGWNAVEVDGHDPDDISNGFDKLDAIDGEPGMLVARTVKGHGVSFLADREDMHGKALSPEDAERAIAELSPGEHRSITLETPPMLDISTREKSTPEAPRFEEAIATRDAFGLALAAEAEANPDLVVLDGEVSNSTRTDHVDDARPEQFIQMYIAEQAMVGAAVGLSALGRKPVVSTFAAFLTRAHDFIRMAAIGRADLIINGSHAGVSIGEDGPSQMGLDDMAMMRGTPGATVLYPADGPSTAALLRLAVEKPGISYIRTTREATDLLYDQDAVFTIGGSHTLRSSAKDRAAIVAAGVTVHEALEAADSLAESGVAIRVIDAYSIVPIDTATIQDAMKQTGRILVVEDHGPVGGLGDAVLQAVGDLGSGSVTKLAVHGIPGSAPPAEQRELAGISSRSIVEHVLASID